MAQAQKLLESCDKLPTLFIFVWSIPNFAQPLLAVITLLEIVHEVFVHVTILWDINWGTFWNHKYRFQT